jgi:hypothetical protein
VVSVTPRPPYSQGKNPWYPLDRRLGGSQSRNGRGGEEKNSQPPPRIEPLNPDRPARILIVIQTELLLNSILTGFVIPMKLFRLIKMCLNETCSKVRISKNLSDALSIQNGLKEGDALSPLFFNFDLKYTIQKVQENQKGLKLKGTHELLVCTDDVNIVDENMNTIILRARRSGF